MKFDSARVRQELDFICDTYDRFSISDKIAGIVAYIDHLEESIEDAEYTAFEAGRETVDVGLGDKEKLQFKYGDYHEWRRKHPNE